MSTTSATGRADAHAPAALARAARPDRVRPLLTELNELSDLAAAPVSRLKLFSKRSAPQALLEATQQACSTAVPGPIGAHIVPVRRAVQPARYP